MAQINKVTVMINVEGEKDGRVASLSFYGLTPSVDDVIRLFDHLEDQVDQASAPIKVAESE